MKNNYVVGGGVSGLIFAFYHPSYTIITPNIGGLFASAYIAIIHDTSETRRFLTDLGYQEVDKLHRKSYIGYYVDGWIRDYVSPSLNKLIIQKKMTLWNEPVNKDFAPESMDMSTSKTVNYFKTMDVQPAEVIEKLKNTCKNIIEGTVIKIDDGYITYMDLSGSEHTLQYDSVVSTVPAPIFWKLYGEDRKFPSTFITNVITDEKPEKFHEYYDVVYYDDSVPWSRITHLHDSYAIELTGNLTDQEIATILPGVRIKTVVRVPYGRISSVPDNTPPNDKITFMGRFSQWKFGVVMEHTIKQSLEFKSVVDRPPEKLSTN